jgi:hypothetical protein
MASITTLLLSSPANGVLVLLLNSYLFECIGNRRLGTAKERGRNEIPAIIDKDIDDKKLKKIV